MASKMAILMNAQETETIGFDFGKVHDSLAEMYNLLEKYSPLWYPKNVHDRARGALVVLRKSSALSSLTNLHK
jgi:hypothetical protein